MKFSHPDDELVNQPIGYWSWAASTSVVGHIRNALATVGLTRPQWWVLNQLGDSAGAHTRDGLTQLLQGYLGVGDQLQVDIDELISRRPIVVDEQDAVAMTLDGQQALADANEVQRVAQAQIHEGVSGDELLTTMKVLQRMIHNTDGTFWHHRPNHPRRASMRSAWRCTGSLDDGQVRIQTRNGPIGRHRARRAAANIAPCS